MPDGCRRGWALWSLASWEQRPEKGQRRERPVWSEGGLRALEEAGLQGGGRSVSQGCRGPSRLRSPCLRWVLLHPSALPQGVCSFTTNV